MMTNSALPENNSYVKELKGVFLRNANPGNAQKMSAYMKGHFPFFGITSPIRKDLMKEFFSKNGFPELREFEGVIKSCFHEKERELHYFAVDIMSKEIRKLSPEFIDLTEWMVVNESWWDTVDAIASNIIGPLLLKHPELQIRDKKYMTSENMWFRRTALLFQLKYKEQTDQVKLFHYCKALASEKEFFIRKAIGWVLREYSKTEPEAVINFVNKTPISALSKREALKWVNKQ